MRGPCAVPVASLARAGASPNDPGAASPTAGSRWLPVLCAAQNSATMTTRANVEAPWRSREVQVWLGSVSEIVVQVGLRFPTRSLNVFTDTYK